MKRNVLVKDFFREIRGSFNRYLSILLIVALGVAFYAGVRSAEPDMKLSADALYDAQNMMDLRVLSELGLTEDDIAALSQIEGVTSAQGGYTVDALTDVNGQHTVVSIQSLGDGINLPELTQGRMPERADECLLDADYMAESGLAIGDTITVYADGEEDILDTLAGDTFTVVGAARYAWYLNFDRGTANIGNGDVGFFLLVPQSAFSLDVYTVAYLTCDAADGYISFDDGYKDYIAAVTDRVEAIAGERCQIRYDAVQQEGADEIADAEQEIDDAEQELEDARQELEDARIQLEDAAQEIADGEEEIADGEKEIADAKAELREKEQELLDGWAELNDAKAELADAEQELHDARVEVVGAGSAISNNRSQLNQQSEQFNAFADQAETLKDPDAYANAQENYEQLQQAQAAGQLPEGGEEALQFYDQILPGLDSAVSAAGGAATEEVLSAAVDGALQPTRDAIQSGYDQLNAASKKVERGREELASAEQEYQDGLQEIAENEQTLLDGQAEIDDAWDEIADAERELEDARQELEDGKAEYADALQEYQDAQAEFDEKSAEAEAEIDDARQQIADAQQELDDLEVPEWFVLDRESIQSYVEYGMDTERIGAIGQVFPAIFFLVAALVSLTTMTRMVEEQRLQIGTMKALGYSQSAIAGKFIGYALSASLIGSVLGIFVGSYLLPYVILSAYGMLYTNMTVMLLPIQWDLSAFALLIAVLCTVAATYAACYAEFRSTPASLMRPASPPQGRRVFLERIPALWKRLSFSQKATFRNLFRYKKRFFMTIFGIGACMGLLLVAFGLRNSIAEIVDKQYETVWTYDTSVSFDNDDPEALAGVEEGLQTAQDVRTILPVQQTSLDARANGVTKSAYVFIPEHLEDLSEIVHLQNRQTGEAIALEDGSVVVTEKLARLLSLEVGDEITLLREETEEVTATVSAIAENYLYHYVYMTPATYEQLFHEAPEYSTVFLRTDVGQEGEDAMAEELLAIDGITGVSFVSDLQTQVSDMMRSLDMVVVVLVVSAGLLAFIVLYNLNNISIIERRRELATLKVLGFYDGEVTAYIYRENIWLTLIGMVLGVGIGFVLHKFIIRTCEVDMIMFGQSIRLDSYLYSILLTVLFSVLVNLFMFFKLRKIDMVESLKSVE